MTGLASAGEARLDVIRTCRRVEVTEVATQTIGGRAGELIIDVAAGTWSADVRSGQRELRERVVVKSGPGPGGRRVTGLAIGGEARLHVVRIGSAVVIARVATDAVRGCALELATHVARGTGQRRVGSGQREAGEPQVVKTRSGPAVHGMARLAGGGELQGLVVRIFRASEILQVAAQAVRREA